MFAKLLAKIGSTLNRAKIPYMIIGGQAVLVYGEPRLTQDIDVALGLSVDEGSKITSILPRMDLIPLVDPGTFTRQTMVLPCKNAKTGIRVDLIFSFTPYEREAIKRARQVLIEKVSVCFASLEDLVIHKIVAGRPRDLEDVKSILLKNKTYDKKYISDWLIQFEKALEKPLLKVFGDMERWLERHL